MVIIYCPDQPDYYKGKGAGLQSDIKSEDLSSDFTSYPPWSLDSLLCHFNSTESIQSCSHFGALNLSYTLPSLSYLVLIFTSVKWSIWGWSALPKDTTSKQCPKIERGETWFFSENPATSRIRNRAAGSNIVKASSSNHCAMSLSMKIYISLFCNIWTIISMYRIHYPNLSTGRYLCCPPNVRASRSSTSSR